MGFYLGGFWHNLPKSTWTLLLFFGLRCVLCELVLEHCPQRQCHHHIVVPRPGLPGAQHLDQKFHSIPLWFCFSTACLNSCTRTCSLHSQINHKKVCHRFVCKTVVSNTLTCVPYRPSCFADLLLLAGGSNCEKQAISNGFTLCVLGASTIQSTKHLMGFVQFKVPLRPKLREGLPWPFEEIATLPGCRDTGAGNPQQRGLACAPMAPLDKALKETAVAHMQVKERRKTSQHLRMIYSTLRNLT